TVQRMNPPVPSRRESEPFAPSPQAREQTALRRSAPRRWSASRCDDGAACAQRRQRRIGQVILRRAFGECDERRRIVGIARDLRDRDDAIVGITREDPGVLEVDAVRILTAFDGLDVAADVAAEEDDPAILAPQMLFRAADGALTDLCVVIARNPLTFFV